MVFVLERNGGKSWRGPARTQLLRALNEAMKRKWCLTRCGEFFTGKRRYCAYLWLGGSYPEAGALQCLTVVRVPMAMLTRD